MNLLLATLAMFLVIPTNAMPQVNCFAYGSGSGSMLSCDSSRGNTSIVPFSSTGGVMTHDRPSSLEPYNIVGQPDRHDTFSSRRDDSFSSRPIEPLNRLDRLDRLDRPDRHSDPLRDPLLPLLLGE